MSDDDEFVRCSSPRVYYQAADRVSLQMMEEGDDEVCVTDTVLLQLETADDRRRSTTLSTKAQTRRRKASTLRMTTTPPNVSEGLHHDHTRKLTGAGPAQRDEPDVALASFQRIVDNENKQGEQSEYGFKALKQMTKLTFRLGRFDAALAHYRVLLSYTKKAVTRNTAEKSINKILDYVSASPAIDTKQMQAFYEVTMQALEDARNERLSQKTNLKLAKLWLDRKEYPRLTAILRELHASCDDSTDDATGGAGGGGGAEHQQDSARGTLQLEVFALEIQMYNEMKNHKKLREIYERSLRVRAAISHPRIQGVIRECGGKMFMSESALPFLARSQRPLQLKRPSAHAQRSGPRRRSTFSRRSSRTTRPGRRSAPRCSSTSSSRTCSWSQRSTLSTRKRPSRTRTTQRSSP